MRNRRDSCAERGKTGTLWYEMMSSKYLEYLTLKIKKLENEKNFLNHIIKLQNVLNMWRMRNVSLLGEISFFKTLAFSKIIHLTLVTSVPSSTIDLLNKKQKYFLWNKKNAKI